MITNNDLQELFNFTPEELDMNERGQISQRQLRRLSRNHWLSVIGVAGFGLALIVFGIFFYTRPGEGAWVITACVVPLGLFLVMSAFSLSRIKVRDLPVENVTGAIKFIKKSDSDSTTYYLRVGDMQLKSNRKRHQALIEGEAYTVYYVHIRQDDSGDAYGTPLSLEKAKPKRFGG